MSEKLMPLPTDHFFTDVFEDRSEISKDNIEDRSSFRLHLQEYLILNSFCSKFGVRIQALHRSTFWTVFQTLKCCFKATVNAILTINKEIHIIFSRTPPSSEICRMMYHIYKEKKPSTI